MASTDPATIGGAAMCDGATGVWIVNWYIKPVIDPIVVTAASDPVNGATVTVTLGTTVGILSQLPAYDQLPGTATVAALAVTLALPDGTTRAESRTIQLGSPCTVASVAGACDPSHDVDFSASADQATAIVTGSCAGHVLNFYARMPDPYGRSLTYAWTKSWTAVPSDTRQVVAVDLPPCRWEAGVFVGNLPATPYSGGSGSCTDDTMTLSEQCPHSFSLTLGNGADAVLPTTFLIASATMTPGGALNLPDITRKVAPGQTVTITFGSNVDSVWVWYWGAQLGGSVWQVPRGGRCSELSSTPPPLPFPGSPLPIPPN